MYWDYADASLHTEKNSERLIKEHGLRQKRNHEDIGEKDMKGNLKVRRTLLWVFLIK